MTRADPSASVSFRRTVVTIALGFLAAVIEGFDLQASGIARAGWLQEFAFDPARMGWILGASTLGLMIGAALGGRLADGWGRKPILVGSVVAYGMFSLASTLGHDYPTLYAARLLAGIGLGGAIPNLIALTSECAGPRFRVTAVSLMYCGMPLGSAITALVGVGLAPSEWRTIFYLGGAAPLAIAPLLAFALPESATFLNRSARSIRRFKADSALPALFGERRAPTTLMLWIAYFFSSLTLYLLISWLPALAEAKGLSRGDSNLVTALFNLASVPALVLFALLLDRVRRLPVVIAMYAGTISAVAFLAVADGFSAIALAAALINFFNSGSQIFLHGSSPTFYPALSRGTGVGAAMASGRFGSFVGPVAAGYLLAVGWGANSVLLGAIPGLLLGAACVIGLLPRPRAAD